MRPTSTVGRASAILAAVGAVLLAYAGVARWWGALASVAVMAWFAGCGVYALRRCLRSAGSGSEWLFGPVVGVGISVVGLLALWLGGARTPWMLLLAPWPLALAFLVPRRSGLRIRLPQVDRRDVLPIVVLLMLVPVIAGLPFAHVGQQGRDGSRAYRAYFTADFVWAMTVVAEVSKGDLPPKNPFQIDGTLHYYWLSHLLSAAEYRVAAPSGLTIEEVILANHLGYDLLFIAFLYGFVRAFGAAAWPAAAACGLAFLANSFEALDRIVVWWNEPSLYPLLTDINVDAVTRWFYSSMPVDGLHRMLLYQPHHLPGYAIGLMALLLAARCPAPGRPTVALGAGAFLGLTLLLSSFTAIIFGIAVGLVLAVRLSRRSQWSRLLRSAAAGTLPVAIAVGLARLLQYVDQAEQALIRLGPNPTALAHWAYALLLSFGPALIIGMAGALLVTRRPWRPAWPAVVLGAVALGFYFLVDVPDMQHVWVGWRAGHLLFIAATVCAGTLFTWGAGRSRTEQYWMGAIVALLALAALPTVAIDVFNAQDFANFGEGPGFPWTLRLHAQEIEALEWLKRNTPADVVVQVDALERGYGSWGYMTAFGERRMAAGVPIAMIPLAPYQRATEIVGDAIFNNGTAEKRSAVARRFGIDYLYVGPAERKRHPNLVELLDSRSDLFPVVFRNDEVVIYWVAPTERH